MCHETDASLGHVVSHHANLVPQNVRIYNLGMGLAVVNTTSATLFSRAISFQHAQELLQSDLSQAKSKAAEFTQQEVHQEA